MWGEAGDVTFNRKIRKKEGSQEVPTRLGKESYEVGEGRAMRNGRITEFERGFAAFDRNF